VQGLAERVSVSLLPPVREGPGVEGSGMGLFVSRRFVELMGGTIQVESSLGKGTPVRGLLDAADT
jgi:signal transduction histidine kinase